ncbi:hypothetical protein KDK88_07930 [bacterium]|nr:hypothetical protein [bacterium]
MLDADRAGFETLPDVDPGLQTRLETLFPDRHESYSIALLDITPGQPVRYAAHQADRTMPPGSIGKLAVAAGLFAELARLYPDDPDKRRQLLRERMIPADEWILTDHHPVPFFDLETHATDSRPPKVGEVFSMYEWTDHMLSASANAAASIVWREAMLMRAFGAAYPPSPEEAAAYFKKTPKSELQRLSLSVINDPLRRIGIPQDAWQLGTFFTKTGQRYVPGAPSYGTPNALLRFLMRLEQGRVVDAWSSLELKRLLYMTAKRIRYASSPAIARSAVYFKSGSLYRCEPEPEFTCRKYMGNVENTMNSIAIVERPDGTVYCVALMSNILRRNSAVEHQTLATFIDRIMGRP